MEGGGDTAGQKKRLREGMDGFLAGIKSKVRENRWKWKLVPCGSRRETYDAFMNARDHAADDETVVLLVDSEEPVTAATPAMHLRARPGDRWELAGVPDDHVHLMVQTMETWIVADPGVVAGYYGQGFRVNALPARANLEEEGKEAVLSALDRATQHTQRGRYHKTRHAADLLKRIGPAKVRQRCRHCAQLFDVLGGTVARA